MSRRSKKLLKKQKKLEFHEILERAIWSSKNEPLYSVDIDAIIEGREDTHVIYTDHLSLEQLYNWTIKYPDRAAKYGIRVPAAVLDQDL